MTKLGEAWYRVPGLKYEMFAILVTNTAGFG
jgi:hypothetical protein